eukprot:5795971-Prymnesium_polylepis.1
MRPRALVASAPWREIGLIALVTSANVLNNADKVHPHPRDPQQDGAVRMRMAHTLTRTPAITSRGREPALRSWHRPPPWTPNAHQGVLN